MSNDDCSKFELLLDASIANDASLSADDVAFLSFHIKRCPDCAVEASVIQSLEWANKWDLTSDLGTADIEFKARQLLRSPAESRERWTPPPAFIAVFATGVSALFLVFFYFVLANQGDTDSATTTELDRPESPLALPKLTLIRGEAQLLGRAAAIGDPVKLGSGVRTKKGRAAIEFDSGTRALVHGQSELFLVDSSETTTRVRLTMGRAVFRVAKLTPERTFEVETDTGRVRVLGTVFSVACSGKTCEVKVAEGRVEYSSASGMDVVIGQGQMLRTGESLRELPREEQLALFEDLADHSKRAPPAAAVEHTSESFAQDNVEGASLRQDSRGPKKKRHRASGRDDRFEREANAVKKANPSVSELLVQAQERRARRDWSGVVERYRRLVNLYPGSPEARTCLVPMGKIQLERLGQAGLALETFNRYVQSGRGGALEEEAEWGMILALRRLKRVREEKVALGAFLRNYPQSLYASWVRERLEKLDGKAKR